MNGFATLDSQAEIRYDTAMQWQGLSCRLPAFSNFRFGTTIGGRPVFRNPKLRTSVDRTQIFHTDRGSEFDNMLVDEILESFQIQRSLSMKGRPYDNAVAESAFRRIKKEFV